MRQYVELGKKILEEGNTRSDRTGTGTRSVFGEQMRFNLLDGFPLVTTRKTHLNSIIRELLWFLKGSTNNKELNEMGCTIWDEWAAENGDLGPIYGKQWRTWENADGSTVDQIENLITSIKERPTSRRHIVSAWNVSDLPDETYTPQDNVQMGLMALAPCHLLFQVYVSDATRADKQKYVKRYEDLHITEAEYAEMGIPTKKLSLQVYCRSQDYVLGTPFNIASYALLTMMLAQCTDMMPGDLIWVGGDTHVYSNHIKQFKNIQLERDPFPLPTMIINPFKTDIFSFELEDFVLENYQAHSSLKYPIAI
jgi:thymidylate synthase